MVITLKSNTLEIVSIKRKTKAKILCDLKPGDKIFLRTILQRTTGGRSGVYSSAFEIVVCETLDVYRESQVNVLNRLGSFELKKVDE